MILVALGANLDGPYGSPEHSFRECLDVIMPGFGIQSILRSSIWKTAPIPASDQPWYKNAVCSIETELSPAVLLATLKVIEARFGRDLNCTERNAPRIIDLDIIAYNEAVMDGNIMIPHPRLHERAFVLYPLREIAPDWRHPVMDKSVDKLIADLPKDQIFECLEGETL